MTQNIDQNAYDVLICGARAAGAATALLLAKAGLRVLVVDRSAPGSDTVSTNALMRPAVLQLHRWGLLEELESRGATRIERTTFHYEGTRVPIQITRQFGVDALYAPRRNVLDPLLCEAARTHGATVLHRTSLLTLQTNARGRVAGALIKQAGGRSTTVRAHMVVGADGIRSRVAKLVRAPFTRLLNNQSAVIYANFTAVPASVTTAGTQWYFSRHAGAGVIPTQHGQVCVFVGCRKQELPGLLRDGLEAGFWRGLIPFSLDALPALRAAARTASFRGFGGHPGYFRQCTGPGWALVGDAGYFRDPITAHGLSDALRDAELLSRAILAQRETALADYEAERDAISYRMLQLSDEIASYRSDMDRLGELHRELSRQMHREAELIAGWDTSPASCRPTPLSTAMGA
jgi:flavin-dependent dehydrogenase